MLENFEAVSPQLAVAKVRFHVVALSVISAHAPHEFHTIRVKSTFGESVRTAIAFASAAGDEVALLGDSNAQFPLPVLNIHDKEVKNKNVAMLRHTSHLLYPPELQEHGAKAPSIASTTPVSLTNCTKRCLSPTLSKDQVLLARKGVDHECIVARLQFEKDATRCDVCTTPSWRDKAKSHLSQLFDMSMLHDERW